MRRLHRDTSGRRMKKRTKYIIIVLILLVVLHFFGAFTHLFEKDFYSTFEYPLNEDITPYVEQLKNNDQPDIPPINIYNYSFIKTTDGKCKGGKLRLLILVKSAINNFERRTAIRNTYGYERRFSDVIMKTVFLLGVENEKKYKTTVDAEYEKYHDIVQANFTDSYYNNTIKTMMGFKWAMEYCSDSKFFLFTDDDMYISIKNVLRFVRNPSNFPEYIEDTLTAMRKLSRGIKSIEEEFPRHKRQIQTFELPDDAVLFTGFKFESSPHRHTTSKWYVSLDEYPWHMWPPYISAGAYILSREALVNMYYASYYTAHFRFDDIYLGILAKKVGIKPFHCKEFYFYKKDYSLANYRYVIASHGFDDTKELVKVWNEQKSAGNA